ncbi:hypothetical protein [Nocardioides terrisoli]|uniref:hypothetical protein n=1 Tax=Nocardioides terrisoli TaxID=3388267 RepID=UPI00287BBB1F|nr:hypothetical protein [Nocardioides marmorisolisilvae]
MYAQFALLLIGLVDKTPKPNDVKAGWGAFALFIGLALAVAFLGWSLSKQLKKAQRAEDEGKYDPSDKRPRRTTI